MKKIIALMAVALIGCAVVSMAAYSTKTLTIAAGATSGSLTNTSSIGQSYEIVGVCIGLSTNALDASVYTLTDTTGGATGAIVDTVTVASNALGGTIDVDVAPLPQKLNGIATVTRDANSTNSAARILFITQQ